MRTDERGWRHWLALASMALVLVAPPGQALGQEKAEGDRKDAKAEAPVEAPKSFTVDRSGTFNGKAVDYSVVAEEIHLKNDKGEATGSVFSISYVKKDVKDPGQRPVTFLFNGGPGSASVWLHMGVFGPRRIVVPSDGSPAVGPPYPLVDNPHTVLDVTDLVFIDPVGTGFSRIIGKGEEKDFYGVREDARSVAQFMRLWLSKHDRWNSPKYMGGESYGGIRIGAVLEELSSWNGPVALNGIMIISGALDTATLDFTPGNEAPHWSFLPSYAATAVHHGRVKLPAGISLEAFVEESRRFALDRYAPALLKGARLPPEERKAVVAQLARFTGLSEAFIDRANLRISATRFRKELLRDEAKTVGRFDSRYTGDDYDDAGETPDFDPSGEHVFAAYTSSVNQYFQNELKIDMGREYKILGSLGSKWNWTLSEQGRARAANVTPWIGSAMRENPTMRVLAAGGYFDLATPFFAVENLLNTNGVPTERVTFTYYPAGHMFYVHEPSLVRFTDDVRRFIGAANPGQG